MHAFLISGGTKDKREQWIDQKLKEWQVSAFDQVKPEETEDPHIGIAQIRTLQHHLILKPLNSPKKVGIIPSAERLTVEAQNALLKTLEEPPPQVSIIIEAQNANSFLPTILSRCHLIQLTYEQEYSKEEIKKVETVLQSLAEASVGERLRLTNGVAKTRADAAIWIDRAIAAVREHMLATYGTGESQPLKRFPFHHAKALRSLLAAQGQLAGNATPQLIIDTIALSIR